MRDAVFLACSLAPALQPATRLPSCALPLPRCLPALLLPRCHRPLPHCHPSPSLSSQHLPTTLNPSPRSIHRPSDTLLLPWQHPPPPRSPFTLLRHPPPSHTLLPSPTHPLVTASAPAHKFYTARHITLLSAYFLLFRPFSVVILSLLLLLSSSLASPFTVLILFSYL